MSQSIRPATKTAIFLGAGASAAEGAPIQSQLFRDYFESVKDEKIVKAADNSPLQMKKELMEFFRVIFDINIDGNRQNLKKVNFPTFEEALGVLDLAELRRETLRKFNLEALGPYGNRIRLVRQFLVLAMAKVIADKLNRGNQLHKPLAKKLAAGGLLKDTVFISTNYDILIDNALLALDEARPGRLIDYGVDFTNFDEGTRWEDRWERPGAKAVGLYKLHGSLNWLYCPTCNTLTLTPGVKGVIRLITDVSATTCRFCKSPMTPIIVPPTFYKDMSRVFLSVVWNKAETALRSVGHIIFCGYSFPDADIHIKYLIKRLQTNRANPRSLRFTVINHYAGKDEKQAGDEKSRYERFLGDKVTYTASSFADFAANPKKFYR